MKNNKIERIIGSFIIHTQLAYRNEDCNWMSLKNYNSLWLDARKRQLSQRYATVHTATDVEISSDGREIIYEK